MRILATIATLLPTLAIAHPSNQPHAHPHPGDLPWAAMVVIAIAIGAGLVWYRRSR